MRDFVTTIRVRGAVALACALWVSGCAGDSEGGAEDLAGAENLPAGQEGMVAAPPPPPPDAPRATGTAGLTEVAPGRFEAIIYAWDGGFVPNEIRVPVGAEVNFRLSSRDQVHGFLIEGTPVELDVFPGIFMEKTHTFPVAGEFLVLCHLYCGGGHDAMRAKVIVEAVADE